MIVLILCAFFLFIAFGNATFKHLAHMSETLDAILAVLKGEDKDE